MNTRKLIGFGLALLVVLAVIVTVSAAPLQKSTGASNQIFYSPSLEEMVRPSYSSATNQVFYSPSIERMVTGSDRIQNQIFYSPTIEEFVRH